MTVSMTKPIFTKQVFTGSALFLALAASGPAAWAQTAPPVDAPPVIAAPVDAAPPAATPPVDVTPPVPPVVTASPAGADSAGNNSAGNSTASSSPKKRRRFRIGPEVGVYLPTSSKARDQFGSTWLTLGLGLGDIGRITPQGQTSFDLQILYQSKNGNHAFLAPVGIGYRVAVSQSGTTTAYVGATADLILADMRSGDYDVHSGLRTGFGGSAVIGVNFGDSGYLEARYLAVSKIKDFDLSGLNVTAGYRF